MPPWAKRLERDSVMALCLWEAVISVNEQQQNQTSSYPVQHPHPKTHGTTMARFPSTTTKENVI